MLLIPFKNVFKISLNGGHKEDFSTHFLSVGSQFLFTSGGTFAKKLPTNYIIYHLSSRN